MDGRSSNSNDSCSEVDGDDVVKENVFQNKIIVPEIGMKFESVEDMFQCFKRYAKYNGFAARKERSKKNEKGILRSVTFVCCRGGKSKSTKQLAVLAHPTFDTGCKVKLTSSIGRDGLWRINKLILEHNHDLSPGKAWLFRCYREIDGHVKKQLEFGDIAGIGPKKSYNQLVIEAGGHENCTFIEQDCRNHIEKARRLRLGEGDSVAIQNYFLRMQAQNSDFFFSMDLDEDGTLRNVFWADPRSREACKEFGDVVTFDTTYLTNKYDMPFAPFVGVNHHGESILLGCGLICSETTETFEWLFRTWLTCMSDIAPQGIITDQDRAMQNAIEIVFPSTNHRWCLWHVMKKLPEKFGSHSEYDSIKSHLHKVVYDTQDTSEFEQGWMCLIEKFELHDNTWLSGLYEERHRWVPCFVTTHFWAGMSTTQRSEGINAFFDGYVNSKTILKQFVEQYSHALKAKIHKENQADFKSFSQNIRLVTTYSIEKQFQRVYTLKKFREVQVELLGMIYCDIVHIRESCTGREFVITEDVEIDTNCRKEMRFTVVLEKDNYEVNCSCRRFQFRGILCKHALFVLTKNKVSQVPDRYIFDRWRKDIIRSHTRIKVDYDSGAVTPEMLRYKQMCSQFYKVADLATDDPDSCSLVMKWLEDKMKELYTKKYPTANLKPMEGNSSRNSPTDAPSKVQDPNRKKGKGRPRQTRLKSPIEGNTRKPKKTKKSNQNVNGDVGQSSQPIGVLCTQESVMTTQNTPQNNPNEMGNMNYRWGFSEHIQSFNPPSGPYGMMPQPSGSYGVMPQPSGSYGVMSQPSGSYGVMPQPSGSYGVMPQPSGSYGVMSQPSGSYGVMPQPSGSYGVMPQPSGSYGMMLQPPGPYGMMPQPSGPYGMMSQPSLSSSESIE